MNNLRNFTNLAQMARQHQAEMANAADIGYRLRRANHAQAEGGSRLGWRLAFAVGVAITIMMLIAQTAAASGAGSGGGPAHWMM